MKAYISIVICLFSITVFAQVGVNTTSPNALLDISTTNPSAPSSTDGLLIPKIDEYPAINPTVLQDGMLVYATGNGSVAKGFYYWDNNTASWISFTGATIEKIDDLLDGKSDNDGTDDGSSIFLGINAGANDDESNNHNVGIGPNALSQNSTGSNNTAIGNEAMIFNSTGFQNTAVGQKAMNFNTSGSNNIAIGHKALRDNTTGAYNTVLGVSAGENLVGSSNVVLGYYAGYNSTGDYNVFLGRFAGYNETNSNRLYIENSSSINPLIYGEFDNDFLRVNGDLEVEKTTNASATVVTPFGYQSSLKLFERGGSGDYGFEFQYDGSPDKLYLWSRTFAGNEGIRMTWLKDGRVGMNDTSPDARLDIEAINQATPNNTDGILIPRVDAFPVTDPGANQNGMLVFLTSDNSFYYWKNSTASWQKVNVERINDLADGKSDNDGSDNGSSIFLGVNAGANDNQTANNNVGIGYNTLQNNVSGSANTAVGSTALLSNTSGSNNSAFGRRALYSATTGSGNSAFGSQSLESNTTGYSNVAFGYQSLTSNTTGYYNTAIGYEALESNTTGNYNTALGYEALSSSSGSDNNTAFGYQSLEANTTGENNLAIGGNALQDNTSGNSNIAIGVNALSSNTTTSNNLAIGDSALLNNTTGLYNISIGNSSLQSNTTGYANTASGYEALYNNTTGYANVAISYGALYSNTTGRHNVAIGSSALHNNTSGAYNTAIGTSTSISNSIFDNTTALGYNAIPNSPNQVRLGNSSVSVIGGYANWSNFSDRRLKTNIQENIVGLEFIKKLRPVSYNYDMDAIARFENTPDSLRIREAEHLKAQEIQTGFIAQEVEQAAQEVGFDFHGIVKPYDENGTYALRYAEFVVPLVKAMQEQQDIIEAQEKELKALRSEVEAIKALLRKE